MRQRASDSANIAGESSGRIVSPKLGLTFAAWIFGFLGFFLLVEFWLWQQLGDGVQGSSQLTRYDKSVPSKLTEVLGPSGAHNASQHRNILKRARRRTSPGAKATSSQLGAPVEPSKQPREIVPALFVNQTLQVAPATTAKERLEALRAVEATRKNTKIRVGGPDPIPPFSEPNRSTPIVVELSAFLDGKRCGRTIFRALDQASVPSRLNFSVLQARDNSHDDCLDIFKTEYLSTFCTSGKQRLRDGISIDECKALLLSKINAWVISPEAGKGPAHQRGIAGELLRYSASDSMCLSMDSHMHFQKGWDDILIDDWSATRNEFAALTAYPADVAELNHNFMIDLCGYSLEAGIPRGRQGGNVPTIKSNAPYLTMNWAAGMSFHRCHMERLVPVDRYLTWIFTGEEVSRAVRAFTHGYDLYLPTNIAVLHEYAHAAQQFHSYGDAMEKRGGEHRARRRLFNLMQTGETDTSNLRGASIDLGKFGLGSQRTLEQFVTWSQTNLGGKWQKFLASKHLGETPRSNFCKTLKRMPLKDEVAMLEAVESIWLDPQWSTPPSTNGNGEVVLEGEGSDVRPKRAT